MEGIIFKKDGPYLQPITTDKKEEKVNSLAPYLSKLILIEPGVTFGEFFDYVMKDAKIYSLIFMSQLGGFDLAKWTDEWNNPDVEDNDLEKLDYIFVSWIAETWFDRNVLEDYVDFHGQGPGEYPEGEKVEDMSYSLSFTPINKLKDLEFKIKTDYEVVHHEKGVLPEKILLDMHKKMTIYDVIGGILDDISFYGEPELREEAQKELERRAKDIEDVIDKKGVDGALADGDLVEWEDIKKDLDIKDEEE